MSKYLRKRMKKTDRPFHNMKNDFFRRFIRKTGIGKTVKIKEKGRENLKAVHTAVPVAHCWARATLKNCLAKSDRRTNGLTN